MWEINEAMSRPSGTVTLAKVMRDFARSDKFKRLAFSTQKGYAYCEEVVHGFGIGDGKGFADTPVDSLTTAAIQRMVNEIGKTQRSKANLIKRYLSTALVWGINHGACSTNPAFNVKAIAPSDDLDAGVALTVSIATDSRPIGANRIRWIAENLPSWMLSEQQIYERSVSRDERVTGDRGIYFLLSQGRVCYVGKSSCIRSRVANHIDRGVSFDRVSAIRGLPEWAMDEVEQCYIARLDPALNLERSRFGQLYEIPGIEQHLAT
jgi:hypothetical protein